jgi:hypothetical protein
MRLQHVRFQRSNGYRLYRGYGFWDLSLGRHRWRLTYRDMTEEERLRT